MIIIKYPNLLCLMKLNLLLCKAIQKRSTASSDTKYGNLINRPRIFIIFITIMKIRSFIWGSLWYMELENLIIADPDTTQILAVKQMMH